jgi:uncharacterized protein YndB with AHSA1/START domain
MIKNNLITVHTDIESTIDKVWDSFTDPKHIVKWNNASPEWHTTKAINNLIIGGKFLYRMEAKDASFGFDFEGTYDNIILNKYIGYTLGDGRKVRVTFKSNNSSILVSQEFEPENENPSELQQTGWQAILNNFKKYTESLKQF